MKQFVVAVIVVASIGLMGFDGCNMDLSPNDQKDDTSETTQ